MKKGTIALIALGALALSGGVNRVGAQQNTNGGTTQTTPTLTPQQAAQIGSGTLPLNTYLNDMANRSVANPLQYSYFLELQKQIAAIQLSAVEKSGFMTYSDGFKDLANRLGIRI